MRWLRWAGMALAAAVIMLGVVALVADSDWGHRQIARQIGERLPRSGLVIGIGRIDGSIYGKARLVDLTLSDPKGRFFEAKRVDLDWRPLAWFGNLLDIRHITAPDARLIRLPKLNPGRKDAPILPAFDLELGALRIDRLVIDPGVAGPRREGRVSGKASIHAGRALVDLSADAGAGDQLALTLDAEPDRNRFDLESRVNAPAGGLFGRMAGTARPFALMVAGDGDWKAWAGQAHVDMSGARVADLALSAKAGQFALDGRVMAETLTKGKVQRLTAPMVRVAGEARLADRKLTGQVSAKSEAINADARGTLDLATSSFAGVEIGARLVKPTALFPNMGGTGLDLKARLTGPFKTAQYEYLLTTQRMTFDQTGFEDVRATGRGQWGSVPFQLPVTMTARRVTGVGDVAGGLLNNLSAQGMLLISGKAITGDGILVRSDKLNGRISLFIDLATGVYDLGLSGQLMRYRIPGLGIVDVKTELKVIPAGAGKGSRVAGRGQAWVRQWENSFLAGLAGGLPVLDTGLTRGPDGVLVLTGLSLRAPALTLSGNGLRRRDGSFHFEGSGRQGRYGQLSLKLEGRIERPTLDVVLARPADGLGLANVRLHLDPGAAGYGWTAQGQLMLGPFAGEGAILLPPGGQAVIDIARLQASGMVARGRMAPVGGALDGTLALSGGGVDGQLVLRPDHGLQRIDAKVNARNARFEGPPALAARRARFDGSILLDPAGMKVDGTLTGEGLSRGNWTLARLAANLRMTGEDGEIRASLAGARGRAFDLQTVAHGRGGTWRIEGGGTIDRKPVRLLQAANLQREAGGWRLQPVDLQYVGGRARVGGLFGAQSSAFQAQLAGMPLGIADLVWPGLGLGGSANGSIDYQFKAGAAPEGKADLRIKGLTRSGLVLSSAPVDMGIVAQLTGSNVGLRAIAMSGGREIGRAQARLTPGPGADLATRLAHAPVFAQVRYAGAADILWRMTGVDAIDISGPVSVAADVTGRVDDPQIKGSLRTTNARLESPLTGTVLTQVQASGRFGGGSKLVLDSLTARSGAEGSVTARGEIDLSSARGFAMDIQIDAKQARLIERDEIAATVTGPLRLKSENGEGLISGDLLLDKSRYVLGKSTAVSALPKLNVREINAPEDRPTALAVAMPWRLAMAARAPGRLSVTGMGMESEWKATLDIQGTPYAPSIRGRADMLRGGYDFAGRRFDLKRGSIRFQGETPADPILDILAEGATQGLTASIRVTGTGQKPEIRFSSVPSLPEDELLSRMLFGTSIANLSAPEALQLASAVASLRTGGDGISPLNALRKAIGLDRLRILPADSVTGQRTSVSAGKYLSRRAYVEVVTDGQGYSATRAEFQVTRWLAILSTISSVGRQSAALRVTKDY